MTDPRYKKTMDYSQLFTASHGFAQGQQIPAVPLNYIPPVPAQHTTPPPSEQAQNLGLFYRRNNGVGNTFNPRNGSNTFQSLVNAQNQAQAQNPLAAVNHMTAQTAMPIRQPAIPPVGHASPVRDSFAGSLAPSPEIWEGLKNRFNQFNLRESQGPTSAPGQAFMSDQEARPFKLPNYLSSYEPRQPLTPSSNHSVRSQPDSPTLGQASTPRGFRPMAAINHNRPVASTENGQVEAEVNIFSNNYKGVRGCRGSYELR